MFIRITVPAITEKNIIESKYVLFLFLNLLNKEYNSISEVVASKIKKAICLSNNICDLIKINESVNQTIKNVILLEQVLCTKLDIYNNKK